MPTPKVQITRLDVEPVGDHGRKITCVAASPSMDPWVAMVEARLAVGRLAITKLVLEIDPVDANFALRAGGYPADGINAAVLKRVPMGAIAAAIRSEILALPEHDALMEAIGRRTSSRRRAINRQMAERVEGNVLGRGRPRLGDDHFRRVAEERLRLGREGARGINRQLGEIFVQGPETIRDWLRRARDLGWLAPGEPGRVSAEPGPRLLEAIEQETTQHKEGK